MRVGLVTAIAGSAVSVATIGAVAATGAHLPHHYSPVVTHFHHKKCTKTLLNGMNDKGTAIGTSFCGKARAFVRSPGGSITPVVLPKSQGGSTLAASNISSNGILAVVAPGSPARSYLIYPKGKVVQIADPLAAGHSTIINSVNRHGAAVGYYCTTQKCPASHAFIYHAGNFRDFTLHHKGAVLPSLSTINDSGDLFGFFYQAPGGRVRSFAKHGHKVRIIDAPKAGHKLGQGTVLLNAANHHAICGGVVGPHHLNEGFVEYRGHMHLISLFKRHAKSFTEIGACNSHGQIGGHARNAVARTYHGFVARVG